MKKLDTKKVWENIKREFEERPLIVLTVASSLLYGGSHLMDANTRRVNAKQDRARIKTYDKEVERRIRADAKK